MKILNSLKIERMKLKYKEYKVDDKKNNIFTPIQRKTNKLILNDDLTIEQESLVSLKNDSLGSSIKKSY